jgi:hypothetical protein
MSLKSDTLFCRIGGVMVSVFALCAVDRVFEPRSGQTKDYKIGICCFSAAHAALRRKSKDWSAWNQNNVSDSGSLAVARIHNILDNTEKRLEHELERENREPPKTLIGR